MKIGRIEIKFNKKKNYKEQIADRLNGCYDDIHNFSADVREAQIRLDRLEEAVANLVIIVDGLTK